MGEDELDRLLRSEKHDLNPGTTADLTAAVIFKYLLEKNMRTASP
jgi:triphosphoribosyl-dephospho-CoA synthetase